MASATILCADGKFTALCSSSDPDCQACSYSHSHSHRHSQVPGSFFSDEKLSKFFIEFAENSAYIEKHTWAPKAKSCPSTDTVIGSAVRYPANLANDPFFNSATEPVEITILCITFAKWNQFALCKRN